MITVGAVLTMGSVESVWACPQKPFDFRYDIRAALDLATELYGNEHGYPFYRVNGYSMEPAYHEGDLLVVNSTVSFADIALGDVVVFNSYADSRTVVHRAIYYTGTHWLTIGDNNLVPNEHDLVGPNNLRGVVQGHYKLMNDAQPDMAGVVIADNARLLERVGLADCPHDIQPTSSHSWDVILNLHRGAYQVDDSLNPVMHHLVLWYAMHA